jgi:uncharacterized protein YqiB (DUF1249 family)
MTDFDNPPKQARVLTIVEADNGVAWVYFHKRTTDIMVTRIGMHSMSEQPSINVHVHGPARPVVAHSVEAAMRLAARYFAEPNEHRTDRALPRGT